MHSNSGYRETEAEISKTAHGDLSDRLANIDLVRSAKVVGVALALGAGALLWTLGRDTPNDHIPHPSAPLEAPASIDPLVSTGPTTTLR